MPTTPEKPAQAPPAHAPQHPQHAPQHASPPPNPSQPPPATPGRAQPDQQPKPAAEGEKKPEEKVVNKDEVRSLFEAGTKLKKKGDPPEKWIAATRLHNTLCLAQPLTEELEKKVLGEELVIVQD